MQPIQVNRKELITKLIENRARHVAEFNETFELFRIRAVRQMEKNLDLARDTASRNVYLSIALQVPKSHEDEYNEVIGLLDMGTADTVELDMDSYKKYVLDKWNWKSAFDSSTQFYKSLEA